MIASEKYIWLWLLTNHPESVGVHWDFYGSEFFCKKEVNFDIDSVDFDAMKPMYDTDESSFTDTFSEPDHVSTLQGELILKDGSKYHVGFCIDGVNMLNTIVNFMCERIENGQS